MATLSIMTCLAAGSIPAGIILLASRGPIDRLSWGDLVFLMWVDAPYLALGGLVMRYRANLFTSVVIFFSILVIGGFGVTVFYSELRPFFAWGPDGPEVMNCAGPIVEVGLPILQWIAIVPLWITAIALDPN